MSAMPFAPLLSAIVFLLFAASGAAALIYEIVWQQLLQLVIGSSTVSLGVLLAIFMGGLCLGSLAAPRLVPHEWHPLRAFALIESGIAACGLILLVAMPLVERLYITWGGQGISGVIVRALVASLCLLPPTVLMGATLPVFSRWVEATAHGMSRLGFFYAGNLLGAVCGCLAAGFYLLRVYDMNVATYAAAALNLLAAATAWTLSRQSQGLGLRARGEQRGFRLKAEGLGSIQNPESRIESRASDLGPRVLVVIALSGFCALSAEVVWTRLLTLLFGATVYTFSIILAVFLVGLGLGSSAGASLARRVTRPVVALSWCQFGAAAAVAFSAYMLLGVLPYWKVDPALSGDIWAMFRLDLLRTTIAILPAPLLWGASFPLALAAAAEPGDDTSRIVGRVYAANTVGAIAGALVTSLVLVAWIGSQHAQQVIMIVAAGSGMLAMIPLRDGRERQQPRTRRRGLATATIAVAAVGVIVLLAVVPALPAVLVGYGRNSANWVGHTGDMLFVGEGLHATVAVSRVADGVLNYHNAGKVQASSQPPDMRLQRMLGHLTTIVPRQPKKVLVIGCGAGVTAGAVSVSPAVESVTIVDIEPLVPQVARDYFGSVNHDVLRNQKVRVVADDARHFLMTTTEKFDAITSDPLDPWVKGAATLYTKEFFETARAHLNGGGVMTLFVQLYESSPEAVKSEIATFFEVFPNGLIFGNTFETHAIDTVLVGQVEPPELYLDYIDEALRTPAFKPVSDSLSQIGFGGAVDLFGNYAGRARDLKPYLDGAQITHDRDLRLQFLAGLGVNLHEGDDIYADILQYRRAADDLFIASESTLWRFAQALEGTRE